MRWQGFTEEIIFPILGLNIKLIKKIFINFKAVKKLVYVTIN